MAKIKPMFSFWLRQKVCIVEGSIPIKIVTDKGNCCRRSCSLLEIDGFAFGKIGLFRLKSVCIGTKKAQVLSTPAPARYRTNVFTKRRSLHWIRNVARVGFRHKDCIHNLHRLRSHIHNIHTDFGEKRG